MQPRPNTSLDPSLNPFPEFDINGQNLEELRYLVWSQAWRGFFEPLLRNLEVQLTNELLDPTEERRARRPDDYLRGAIYVTRNLLNLPAQAIQEADVEAEEENKRREEERLLRARAAHGFHNPFGPTPTGGM